MRCPRGLLLGALALLCGCAATSSGSSHTGPSGTITVAAAASLNEVFTALKTDFDKKYPGVHIDFDFGSSGVLEAQITHGAPADVFASADNAVMDRLHRGDFTAEKPIEFATNSLEIVVRPGNPLGIKSLPDLHRASVVALCALQAPCGSKAAEALRVAGVDLPTSKVTRAQDVKATLRQVTLGDADAAIVYVTDARTVSDTAQPVPIDAAQNVHTAYPIAVVKGTGHAALARLWISYVTGADGRAALRRAGFGVPG